MFCPFQNETHFNLTQLAYQLYLLSPDAYGLVISQHNCQCEMSPAITVVLRVTNALEMIHHLSLDADTLKRMVVPSCPCYTY